MDVVMSKWIVCVHPVEPPHMFTISTGKQMIPLGTTVAQGCGTLYEIQIFEHALRQGLSLSAGETSIKECC